MLYEYQLYVLVALNAVCTIIVLTALTTNKLDNFSVSYRISIMIIGVGCIGTIAVLLQMLVYRDPNAETHRLYWIIKDAGMTLVLVIAFYDVQLKRVKVKFSPKKGSLSHD